MPTNPRDQILRLATRNKRFLDRLDLQMTREVNKAYGAARRELVGLIRERRAALLQGTFRGERSTRERELARDVTLLQQIEGRLATLTEETGGIIQTSWDESISYANELSEEEIAAVLEGLDADQVVGLPGIGDLRFSTSMIDFSAVEIGLEESLAAIQQSQAQTARVLRTELRTGLLRGESFDDLVKRLMAANGSVFSRGRLSALLGARRNVIYANNGSRQAWYEYWGQEIPGLEKQAVAAIDQDTTNCCLRVHGQIQPLGDPYELKGTPRFAPKIAFPPFHWNCRTSSTAYHRDFERGAQVTTTDMRRAARAEIRARRDGSREEIHPAHATSGRG
jgi:hypothetical protein